MKWAGVRYRLARMRREIIGRGFREAEVPIPCSACGGIQFLVHRPVIVPDFDPSILPPSIARKLLHPRDGYCMICGHYQRIDRLSEKEVGEYISSVKSKDQTVGEEMFHHYPIAREKIREFERSHFDQRLERWKRYFEGRNLTVSRALVLRPFFGAVIPLLRAMGCREVCAIEISDIAKRTTKDAYPFVTFIDENIHASLSGAIAAYGPFDIIIVHHVLQHCVDIGGSLNLLNDLLSRQGLAIFAQEIGRKEHNPFHMNHFSEVHLKYILGSVFPRVDRIDDCDPSPPDFIKQYTAKGDSPDLVAFKG